MLWSAGSQRETPVRVVNLSAGGAAVEGAFRDPLAGRLKILIEWFGIVLTLDAEAVCWSLGDDPPTAHLAFRNVANTQRLLLAALIGAMAAKEEQQLPQTGSRRGWLRIITGSRTG